MHGSAKRSRGGLVFKAHRLCVSLNSRLERNEEEEKTEMDGSVQEMDGSEKLSVWLTETRLEHKLNQNRSNKWV